MQARHITMALIIALAYEILYKISGLLLPSVQRGAVANSVTTAISFLIVGIIILFLLSFSRELKDNKAVRILSQLIIACFVLHLLLRMMRMVDASQLQTLRAIGYLISFIQSILLVALMGFYRRQIPSGAHSLLCATTVVTVMLAAGIAKSALEFIDYLRFALRGIMTEPSAAFCIGVFFLFLLSHGAMIYFLCCYYNQLKMAAIERKTSS